MDRIVLLLTALEYCEKMWIEPGTTFLAHDFHGAGMIDSRLVHPFTA